MSASLEFVLTVLNLDSGTNLFSDDFFLDFIWLVLIYLSEVTLIVALTHTPGERTSLAFFQWCCIKSLQLRGKENLVLLGLYTRARLVASDLS